MTKIAIIDTETASMKGNICEMGIARFTTSGSNLILESCHSDIVDPQEKIDFEAMNVHHITESMVKGKPLLEEVLLPKYSLAESDYVVAHNLSYEEAVLPEDYFPEGIKRLCTLKLARMLYPKGTVASHKLGVLFYTFGLDQDERVKAFEGNWHRASYDTFITGLVLEYILLQNNLSIDEAWEKLYDFKTCRGGNKYKWEKWLDIIQKDYDYVDHTFKNVELDQEELDYLEELLEEYSHLKEEQLDLIGFGKLKGKSWKESVVSDRGYVVWAVNTLQWRNPDELAYVKGLLSGEGV